MIFMNFIGLSSTFLFENILQSTAADHKAAQSGACIAQSTASVTISSTALLTCWGIFRFSNFGAESVWRRVYTVRSIAERSLGGTEEVEKTGFQWSLQVLFQEPLDFSRKFEVSPEH
ncbi:hypothetical protein Tco_0332578 [Tanacetum coccineum]